jgi:nicotinamide-nucleotide amidase
MSELTTLIAAQLLRLKWRLATAESCTGGMIAARCTDLAGSSNWFECGYVTYSNQSKTQMLGVASELIASHGAVSETVARAMAMGASYRSQSLVSVAVTGVAGPGGGSPDKPVGTVWLAWCVNGQVTTEIRHFEGSRHQVREATTVCALQGLLARLPA